MSSLPRSGAFCADYLQHYPGTVPGGCYIKSVAKNGTISYVNKPTCWTGPGPQCGDPTKTQVFLFFGSQQYVGLGFLVFA